MELRHLRYLAAVAEHGTFREASRRLHVSQSAISEQISDLEREVGGALLERGQRTTRLTAQGRVFLAEAQKTLASAERAVDLTRRSLLGQEGALSIGFFLWGAGGFFASIIREYRKLHPQVKLTLLDMHAYDMIEALKTGRIDVGLHGRSSHPMTGRCAPSLCIKIRSSRSCRKIIHSREGRSTSVRLPMNASLPVTDR